MLDEEIKATLKESARKYGAREVGVEIDNRRVVYQEPNITFFDFLASVVVGAALLWFIWQMVRR
jgi:hypothetical protein